MNIDEAAVLLVKQMMPCDTDLPNEEHDWDGIKVNQDPRENWSQSMCCCEAELPKTLQVKMLSQVLTLSNDSTACVKH